MVSTLIFGASGLGGVVRDILLQCRSHRVVAFLDSDPLKHGRTLDGLPVLGGLEALATARCAGIRCAIVAVGANAARISLAAALENAGFELVSAIHPLASMALSANVSRHVIIGPRVTICVHARIADHCVLSAGSIVDHDGVLEMGAFLHPAVRLAGGTRIGAQATLGIGASVIPGRSVGVGAYVAPGAVVIRDVPAWGAVAGVPALEAPVSSGRFMPDGCPAPAPAGRTTAA